MPTVAAMDRGRTAGAHGLPLFGGGNSNDGINRVSVGGRGESVWLGWFLHRDVEIIPAIHPVGSCQPKDLLQRSAEQPASIIGSGYRSR